MHRYTQTAITLATLLLATNLYATEAQTGESLAAEARQIVKQFGSSLKGTLQSSMKSEGPLAAIKQCNLQAPAIAEQVAAQHQWQVGRTSLKIRNRQNAPDDWEFITLSEFEQQLLAGKAAKDIETYTTVERNGKQYFRYMKAIPTGKVCLSCHGAELSPELTAELDKLYPIDQARGYHVGEIRGAFTLTKEIK